MKSHLLLLSNGSDSKVDILFKSPDKILFWVIPAPFFIVFSQGWYPIPAVKPKRMPELYLKKKGPDGIGVIVFYDSIHSFCLGVFEAFLF